MNKIRWGILSTANIAQTELIPAIFRAKNAEVIAIASRGSKVYQVALDLNIPKAYENYDELLEDENIDAVYIPLPNHLHKEWVFKAAKQGKHVLCEKPVSLTAEEAHEMVQICKEYNVKFMEAFMYQFHPQHARVKEIISSGEIGEVKMIRSSHSFYFQDRDGDIRMNKDMGGGSVYDVGCYSIHAIRSVLQTEPIKVHVYAKIDRDTNVDTSAFAYMELENGVTALVDCSFDMVERNEYEIIGTQGSIKVPYAFRPDRNGGGGHVIVKIGNKLREEIFYGDIYCLEVEHFSQAILEDFQPSYSGESAVNNMRVINAFYESIKTGQSVNVKR
ncbi:Gfo/Idh/MocA family protein [Lysinibacillus telephonicus]|uniref:Gfo/Idh/MocA family oxidoreductase n=1 Tax=Lysinibacillus telephonicus TaxID=1714840 RepID=A0A431UVG1_9BACI|nr:Gfo/Idh/MocA family oxidoreductase [Lysinibacillus telephonicus]RTQ95049.1 Gfo/Idh/MocA family oxidoreductase [Lysinibacillus telephonicus]